MNAPSSDSPWTSVDPLGEALYFLRMSGVFYCRSELTAPWAFALPAIRDCLMFHAVVSGRCWLDVAGAESCLLQPGDLAFVPHGEGHTLTSEPYLPAAPYFDLPREQVSERYEIFRYGGGGAPTQLICWAVRFDHPAAHHLIAILPKLIRVDSGSAPQREWIQSALSLMAAEARELRPGGETIVTRLADILVIQAIRSWLAQDAAAQKGWLGALQDRQIGPALTLLYRDPARPWSLASLAAEAAMSRSAFAARFTELVGEPAMHYVARWRMRIAQTWLQEDGVTVGEIASRLGYQSEAAFSRAFKRINGIPPGAYSRNRLASLSKRGEQGTT